jgi:hypothetical protein
MADQKISQLAAATQVTQHTATNFSALYADTVST